MAGRIPQHFIDDLIERIDITEIINQRVTLKRQGKEFSACCPFHNEKSPSFTVSPAKQFYHCFGCGAHGSVISFLMEYDNLSYVEAIETLAEHLHLEVPRENSDGPETPRQNLKPILEALELASQYFQQQLRRAPPAIDYLKNRGVNGETAVNFQIGFAPAGWDNLLNALQSRCSIGQLSDAGLLSENDSGRRYDKFRERVMFPIRNPRGQVVAFGGRILENGEPKYLNSPETPVFNKSNTLYGIYEARKANARLDHYIIVEGYMDVVALAQFGVSNAVATLGTATTSDHVRQLLRGGVHKLIFCFDGDRAGRDAAWRGLTQAIPVLQDSHEIRFLFLPDGEDPDTYIRQHGAEAFQNAALQAPPLSQYLLDILKERHDFMTLEGRASLLLEANKLLQPLQAALLKQQLEKKLAELTNPREQETVQGPPQIRRQGYDGSQEIEVTPMRLAITAAINEPQALREYPISELLHLENLPGGELLCQIALQAHHNEQINTASLTEYFRETVHANAINQLLRWRPPNLEESSWSLNLGDAIRHLSRQTREQRINELLRDAGRGELTAEEKQELTALLTERSQ